MYEFNYVKPATVADAIKASTEDSRYLAGAQSLVQSMKLRMASAESLIDLGAIPDLKDISATDTHVKIGAMATHAQIAADANVQTHLPGLASMAGGIGDPMVRNMGTLGGSIANADPAACYPAAVLALDAVIETDRRKIPADAFFTGMFETALEADELIIAVHFARAEQSAYYKHKQPASRFALVGVMVAKQAGQVRVGVTGAAASAFRWTEAEAALSKSFSASALSELKLAENGLNQDMHGSAAYRAAMVGVCARRAVEHASA